MSGPSLDDTRNLVKALFAHRRDKCGDPYFNHLERVEKGLPYHATEDMRHAALLHDAIEDVGVTIYQLKKLGYTDQTIALVCDLTHDEKETYERYLDLMRGKWAVLEIKLADLLDNGDERRLRRIEPETAAVLRKKYRRAIDRVDAMLSEIPTKPFDLSQMPRSRF